MVPSVRFVFQFPCDFDLEGLQQNLAVLDALRLRLIRLARLYRRMQDSDMAQERPDDHPPGRAFLKVAGKDKSLDELKKMPSARSSRQPSAPLLMIQWQAGK